MTKIAAFFGAILLPLLIVANTACRSVDHGSHHVARDATVTSISVAPLEKTDFSTIAEAEKMAGYTVPSPSAYYPMGFGQTHLRVVKGAGKLSTTQYIYPPLAPNSIEVDAGPQDAFNVAQFKAAPQFKIGTDSGWLLRRDNEALQFAFQYGSAGTVPLWCVVQGPAEMGFESFRTFVESLQWATPLAPE